MSDGSCISFYLQEKHLEQTTVVCHALLKITLVKQWPDTLLFLCTSADNIAQRTAGYEFCEVNHKLVRQLTVELSIN